MDCLQGYYFGAPTVVPPWKMPQAQKRLPDVRYRELTVRYPSAFLALGLTANPYACCGTPAPHSLIGDEIIFQNPLTLGATIIMLRSSVRSAILAFV